ncbi:MAG: hypothetical protein PWQ18_159 [Clostridia bacterium]|nr:hypothetical protein [Clostridia bacterium]
MKAIMAFYQREGILANLVEDFPAVDFVFPQTWQELARELPGAEILVILGTRYNPEVARLVVSLGKSLRWIQATTAGVDAFLINGYPAGATLTKGTGIWDVAVAEHAIAFILAFKRNIVELERTRQARLWDRDRLWAMMGSLEGKTVGIAGYGNIGKEIAKRLLAFDVKIIAYDLLPNVKDEKVARVYSAGELIAFLQQSDIVVLTLPHTPATEYILDAEQLAQMKPTALLINVARGKLIRESALVQALKTGQIAGAGIDVFEEEPLPPTSELWDLSNVILSPHCAATGDNDLINTYRLVRENFARYLQGEVLRNVFDSNRGY